MKDSSTFVREAFYIEPPHKSASIKEWKQWIKTEALKARGAKAAFTRSQPHTYAVDDLPELGLAKRNGRWVQCARVGLNGGGEDDASPTSEPVCDPTQEQELDQSRMLVLHRRGGERKSRKSRRRARLRQQKRGKFRS